MDECGGYNTNLNKAEKNKRNTVTYVWDQKVTLSEIEKNGDFRA